MKKLIATTALALSLISTSALALNPYQQGGSIDAATCTQCIIRFPVVPAGKTLVITNVSAQIGSISNVIVIEGTTAAYFVPIGYVGATYLNQPVTIYFNAGSTPTARIFNPNPSQHTSLIVTLTGYLNP